MPCSIPSGPDQVLVFAELRVPAQVSCLSCCFLRYRGGSASTSLVSRHAEASHALRPAQLLTQHTWALSRGSALADCSARALASYQVQPTTSLGWVLPSLVICAVEAHPPKHLKSGSPFATGEPKYNPRKGICADPSESRARRVILAEISDA